MQQCMVSAKVCLFQYLYALDKKNVLVGFTIAERIGRTARGFDHAIGKRELKSVVLTGTIAKLSQNMPLNRCNQPF